MHVKEHSLFIPSDESIKSLQLPTSLKRRAPRIWKIAYGAVSSVIESSGITPEAVICGTALGALDETMKFINKIHSSNMGSPRQFIASVHNSMAGIIAMEFNINGSNMTLCDSHNSLASSLSAAMLLPEQVILVLIIDESIPFLDEVYDHCPNREAFTGAAQEGALALILDKSSSAVPQVKATAPKPVPMENFTGSFISPALELEELLNENRGGTIRSYSPTSGCASVTTLSYE